MTTNAIAKKGFLYPEMFRGLIEAAIWTNDDFRKDSDASIDDYDDFAPSAIAYLQDYCREFASAFPEFCVSPSDYFKREFINCTDLEYVGHDLWLTTCGHGAGFWDGDWLLPIATQLSEWCSKHGNIELYVGDDRLIHVSGKENYSND